MADWENEYRTMTPAYEVKFFVPLPILWNRVWSTAVRNLFIGHTTSNCLGGSGNRIQGSCEPSIFVRFRLQDMSPSPIWSFGQLLPGRYHPASRLQCTPESYSQVQIRGESYWIASQRVEAFAKECGFEDYTLGSICTEDLAGKVARHPFIDQESKVVAAEYVTMDTGTGCVHIAPGHGLDDYLTGLEHGLEIYCPLNDGGKYLDDGQVPQSLVGLSVLEKEDGSKANHAVLEILRSNGSCLLKDHHHQYPHCWRSKSPVIFRAMDQWFVGLDKMARKRSMNAIQDVSFTPEWGMKRILGFLILTIGLFETTILGGSHSCFLR